MRNCSAPARCTSRCTGPKRLLPGPPDGAPWDGLTCPSGPQHADLGVRTTALLVRQKAAFAQFLNVARRALHDPLGGIAQLGEAAESVRGGEDRHTVLLVGVEPLIQPAD